MKPLAVGQFEQWLVAPAGEIRSTLDAASPVPDNQVAGFGPIAAAHDRHVGQLRRPAALDGHLEHGATALQ